MPVLRLEIFPVVQPFLQLAELADLVGRQSCPRRAHFGREGTVRMEERRGFIERAEHVAENLHVHRRARRHGVGTQRDAADFVIERAVARPRRIVLRRIGRRSD